MNKFYQPFHLVSPSPWPLLTSLSIMNNLILTINWLNKLDFLTLISIPCTILCITQWWRDIIRESLLQGSHTPLVFKGLQLGMIFFIISESFFFLSFFWSYFHFMLAPSIEIGQIWPPLGILPFNPFDIPLLNSIILLSSGLTVSWSHHSLINSKFKESYLSLTLTIILGIYFTLLQIFEYFKASFTISDSIYGSIFFLMTGFHGCHVIIGNLFLLTCLIRLIKLHLSPSHHFSLSAAIWYWHFVDVIWLFLYIFIYWWTF